MDQCFFEGGGGWAISQFGQIPAQQTMREPWKNLASAYYYDYHYNQAVDQEKNHAQPKVEKKDLCPRKLPTPTHLFTKMIVYP